VSKRLSGRVAKLRRFERSRRVESDRLPSAAEEERPEQVDSGDRPTPGLRPPPRPRDVTDPEVRGCVGTVTVRIAGGEVPGEVQVYVRGTWELFIAYALEPTERGAEVRVDASRGHRAVDVTWTGHGSPPGTR
jgi:hypothetical protein